MFSVLSNQAYVKYNYFEILSYPSQQNLSSRNQVIKDAGDDMGKWGPPFTIGGCSHYGNWHEEFSKS